MAEVKFKNTEVSLEVKENTTLSEAIRSRGFFIETPCNGEGNCGKCKVKVTGPLSSITEKEIEHINVKENKRLACCTRILGNIEIELLETETQLSTINTGNSLDIDIDSDIGVIELLNKDDRGIILNIESLGYDLSYQLLQQVSSLYKSKSQNLLGVVFSNKVIDIVQSKKDVLGVAVDIGTTGISVYLLNINTGEILDRKSALNPQAEYGGDVLSRIAYSINNSDRKERLKRIIIDKINEIILQLLESTQSTNNIYKISISANTVMLHILLGLNTENISKAPYNPEFLNKLDIRPNDIAIDMNKEGIITLLPSASAYIGADIISGAIATGFNKKKYNSVFIDIGTNGEILAISDGKIVGTSTAAGPAFEGMNISCGRRAEPGAIDKFKIINDEIIFTTINGVSEDGICGSGLIDIISEFIKNKIILKSGRFNDKLKGEFKPRLRNKKFYITDDIYISQKDIRQVQLAKGAIAAGVTMLLSNVNLSINDIEEIVVAGSFGYHLNPESIKTIGIIPMGFEGNIDFVGNSSIEGARLSIINKHILNDMIKLKNEIEVLELSMGQDFQDCFIKELNF